jgi:hypothetical protein
VDKEQLEQNGHGLGTHLSNAYRSCKQSNHILCSFLLKSGCLLSLRVVLLLVLLLLLRDALEFFFCTILALEDSTPFPRVFCARPFLNIKRPNKLSHTKLLSLVF